MAWLCTWSCVWPWFIASCLGSGCLSKHISPIKSYFPGASSIPKRLSTFMKSLKQVVCWEVLQKTESINRFSTSRRQCMIIHGRPYSLDPKLLSLGSHLDKSFLWSNKGKASLGNDPWKTTPPPIQSICREAVVVIGLCWGLPLGKAMDACA